MNLSLEVGKAARRTRPHLAAQEAWPAQQQAGRTERLACPGPERETVDVAQDQPVAELEACVPAALTEDRIEALDQLGVRMHGLAFGRVAGPAVSHHREFMSG
ncbi:MAG: hypothetical protein E6Q93_05890 [Burkholderiaceae bacterium]|nr:MAG: hypothetical protein E6Q93_05890 [Burkholderiaceae bacterium]